MESNAGTKPQLSAILVCGYAGSGKTELSKMLASRLSFPLVDKDTLTRPLVEKLNLFISGNPHDRDTDRYRAEVRPLEYQILMDATNEILEHGSSVVVSAPFLLELRTENWVKDMKEGFQHRSINLIVVWVHCDSETNYRRIVSRGEIRDQWKLNHWVDYEKSLSWIPEPTLIDYLIDNSSEALSSLKEQGERISYEIRSNR